MISRRITPSGLALLFAAVAFCSSGVTTGRAVDYYLGSSAGTQAGTPIADLAALNARTLKPGDRVFLAGNETFHGTIELGPEDAGTPSAPVLITTYGSGRATINAGNGSALKIYNAAGFVVRNLDLEGSGATTNTANGIDAGAYLADDTKLPYLRFEQMKISGFKKGVLIWGWYSGATPAWPGFRDVKLTDLDVFDNLSGGIETWGTKRPDGDGTQFSHADFTIEHCNTWDNHGDPASTQHTGSGIIVGGVDGAVVQYCVAHDNGGYGPASGGGPFGIWAWEARRVTLQYNLVYNQKSSSTLDGGAYDLDGGCSHCIVQYNYSYHNEGPAIGLIQFNDASPHADSIVRYNISENDCRKTTQGVIYVAEFSEPYGIDGADIYGNTIFVSTNPKTGRPPVVRVENDDDIAGVRVRNNLFVATHTGALLAGATLLPSKVLYQGNNYWGGSIDLTSLRAAGQETLDGVAVGSRVDPQLTSPGNGGTPTDTDQLPAISAYLLKSASPLISSGLDLAGRFACDPGPHDFYGVPLAQPLSVGASTYWTPEPAPAPVPTPIPTIVLDDEFSGSGSMSGRLADTIAPLGQKWKIEAGTGIVGSGESSTKISFRTVIETGVADCSIATRIKLTTAAAGLIVRSSDSSNYLRVILNSGSLVIQKTQAGATTVLSTTRQAFVLGNAYDVVVTLSGPSVSVAINGVTAVTTAISFNQTATKHGLLAVNSGLRYWDYFTVTR